MTPPVDTQSATDAYESVLRFAGATRPVRDVVDDRIVEEIRAGTGRVIDSQREVGGWPVYLSADAPTDSDHDGMPDDWEREYGMTPDDAEDGRADLDGDGYTNVEEYLNATDPTRNTSGGPSVQSEPFVQKGNDALRFGVARTAQEWTPHDPAARSAFVDAVEASGQEVGDYVGLDFTRLPAGDFVKGYSGANITVTLTKAFEMATYEVTQGQWTAVMGGKPWLDREWAQDAPENAATSVSWHDCQEFVARLNACGDREYRLPTEAELDYASRAGHDGTAMFWLSDEQIGDHAWYGRNTVRAGEKYAHPVGRKEPSPWGVHDLAGNALEWCYDRFEYWYWGRGETKTDPMGPEGDASIRDYYVVRGGSFYYSARLIRTEYDRSNDIDPSKAHRATYRNFDVGFRVVRVSP